MADPDPKIVNLTELAEMLRTSVPTLKRLLGKHPDFPVVQHGKNGVAYEFDLGPAAAWWREHSEQVAAADDERRSQLDMWEREIFGSEPPAEAEGLSPSLRKVLADAIFQEDRNRVRRGELVEAAEYEHLLMAAVIQLRKGLMEIPSQLAKSHGIARDLRIAMEGAIERRLSELADELGQEAA